jgi:siroheme synthase
MDKGKVILTGAGPGDPDLITLKAVEALSSADTILYDKLANPELLNYCSPDAELIFSGKEAGGFIMGIALCTLFHLKIIYINKEAMII